MSIQNVREDVGTLHGQANSFPWRLRGFLSRGASSSGTVLVAVMTVGTLFTLFVVPVFYSVIAARHAPEPVEREMEEEEGPAMSRDPLRRSEARLEALAR